MEAVIKCKKDDPTVPDKVMEKIIVGGIEKHMKDYTGIHSQRGFIRVKSCLSNVIPFLDKVIVT